jgi:hypothetical protein
MFRGKMLGETDAINGHEIKKAGVYTTTVKCVSQTGTLLYISKTDFNKLSHNH